MHICITLDKRTFYKYSSIAVRNSQKIYSVGRFHMSGGTFLATDGENVPPIVTLNMPCIIAL